MKRILASLLIATVATASFAADFLNVGDKAPALKIAKWVKGKPQPENLANGKVKVVEFWATWCGPCKTTIPHLTELAKKYDGKVDFVGVSVWETKKDRNSKTDFTYLPVVEKFVADWGAKMDYNVAVDGPEGYMAEKWMTAAGESGIPSAFVVNEEGRIVFIGHPMDENFEKAIEGTLAKTWDWKAESTRRAKEMAAAKALEVKMAEIAALEKEKKYDEALAKIDAAVKEMPELAEGLSTARYRLLRVSKPAEAEAMLRAEAAKDKPNLSLLYDGSMEIVNSTDSTKKADYDLAIVMLGKMDTMVKDNVIILGLLADAHAKKGDLDKAIAVQTKVAEIANKDADMPAQMKANIKKKLEEFKAKKAAGGTR